MKIKIITIIVVSSLIALISNFIYLRKTLPIEYYICDKGYTDCELIARFKDMDSCETTNQKWGWYCDQTDKSNIVCEERESFFVDSYCTK